MVAVALVWGLMNDANWVSFGGAGAFAPHKTVHMLGEDINIRIFDDKIHVRVFFSFENRGPATAVEMAFPFEDTHQAIGESFLRFATKIDGLPVAVRKVEVPTFTLNGKEFKEDGFDIARPFAYVKSVTFDENQRRTVLVDYVTNHGYAGTGWLSNDYILHTGATWAGKIGQCTITVDWSATKKISKPSLHFVSTAGKVIEKDWVMLSARKATLTLTDFEPDFDLDLTGMEAFWNVRLNGEALKVYRGHSGATGPILSGPNADPFIYTFGIQAFFDEGNGYDREYFEGTVANAFGNFVGFAMIGELVDGLGRRHVLKRKAVDWHEHTERARLKDIVEALGGTFKWDAEWERIDITLPTREKPLRKKGDPLPPLRTP